MTNKEKEHQELEQAIEQFKNSGGKVERCATQVPQEEVKKVSRRSREHVNQNERIHPEHAQQFLKALEEQREYAQSLNRVRETGNKRSLREEKVVERYIAKLQRIAHNGLKLV